METKSPQGERPSAAMSAIKAVGVGIDHGTAPSGSLPAHLQLATELRTLLSPAASITNDSRAARRWSDYKAPSTSTVVNVGSADDVQQTVRFCTSHGIPFLAQSGGHGWSKSLDLDSTGVIINMRGLNDVSFSADRSVAKLGGGVIMQEAIEAAYEHDAQLATGSCNGVGMFGVGLGGGYGYLVGKYGYIIDNFLSLDVVLADGRLVTVTPEEEETKDLWWAMRGAGHNFGIVTSGTMKSYPVPREKSTAWTGAIFFTEDKLEQVVQVYDNLELEPQMAAFFAMADIPPMGGPVIMIPIFFAGDEVDGRRKFAPLLECDPLLEMVSMQPYNRWNDPTDPQCVKGGRKPAFAAGFTKLVPTDTRQIWNLFTEFCKGETVSHSIILIERFPLQKARGVPRSAAAFVRRDLKYNAACIACYTDERLDSTAEEFGRRVRSIWQQGSGLEQPQTYVSFAHGDETNEEIYGDSLGRLQQLKKLYDPNGVFSHYHPIRI